jgi:hypothetical protein
MPAPEVYRLDAGTQPGKGRAYGVMTRCTRKTYAPGCCLSPQAPFIYYAYNPKDGAETRTRHKPRFRSQPLECMICASGTATAHTRVLTGAPRLRRSLTDELQRQLRST